MSEELARVPDAWFDCWALQVRLRKFIEATRPDTPGAAMAVGFAQVRLAELRKSPCATAAEVIWGASEALGEAAATALPRLLAERRELRAKLEAAERDRELNAKRCFDAFDDIALALTERNEERALREAIAAEARERGAALRRLRAAASDVLLYDGDRALVDLDGSPIAPGTGPFARLRSALATDPTDGR